MEHEESKVKVDDFSIEQTSQDIEQSRNILEEIKIFNQEMNDPKYKTLKKSTYWHQQSSAIDNFNIEALLKNMMEQLMRIEAKLSEIEALVTTNNE